MKIDVTTDRAKEMARTLKGFLDQETSGKFKHVNALEAVARMLGHRNHNAMMAALPGPAGRQPMIKTLGESPTPPSAFTLAPFGFFEPVSGAMTEEAGVVEIDLARILADPALRREITRAHDAGRGLVSPRLLAGQPEIDAFLAALPFAEADDIDSSVWIDLGDWIERLEAPLAARLGIPDDGAGLALGRIDDAQAARVAPMFEAARQPDPVDGDARIVPLPAAPRDPDDAMAGRFDRIYRVVIRRNGAWQDVAGVDNRDQALEVARAFAGQPAPEGDGELAAPAQTDPDRFPVRFEIRETPRLHSDGEQAIGSVLINGRPHHITLTRVVDRLDEDVDPDDPDADVFERQGASDPSFDYRVDALRAFERVDEDFMPLAHEEGAYLCVITPNCR